MKKETMLQYVMRKLCDPAFNTAEAARRTGISNPVLCNMATGKVGAPSFDKIEKLYEYYKSLAD